MCTTSYLAEELVVSKEGLSSMELVNYNYNNNNI
jgi:hypothetical protein